MTIIDNAAQYSRYLNTQLNARPRLREWIEAKLDHALEEADLLEFLAQSPLTDDTLMPQLRHLRAWAYGHVMTRDLAGKADLFEVTRTMTLLAQVSVSTALRVITAQFAERHGLPRDAAGNEQELIVIGMGKLGGGELNVSSDIDLIFVYPEDCETDGARPIGAFEFYSRVGRRLIQSLNEMTGEGYVFRVDMRLRPNGDSGPLVANFDMLENYFFTQGREWERYAWIKARALTGGQTEALEQIARPFIFRKYLDFGAIDAMRGLHAQIRREVARREMVDNVKLGPGGIREIEFMAQVFQLIRGGRDKGLQIRPTLQVLAALAERDILPAQTVQELTQAYIFLRNVEHRIQYLDDAQTHMLPSSPEDQTRIAQNMGFADYAAMQETLAFHRKKVAAHFEAVFAEHDGSEHELENLWNGASHLDTTGEKLAELKYRDPADLALRLQTFRQGNRYRDMRDDSRARLDVLVPRVLELCAKCPNPDSTLIHMLELLEAICRRAAYLSLLHEYPQTLARVIELVSRSSWGASFLTKHPLLLDELIDGRLLSTPPDLPQFAKDLRARLDELGEDVEEQMDAMREAHHAQVFRLLNQDINNKLTVERLSDHLSKLADVILQETLHQCWKKLTKKHTDTHRFAIIGYGKLGGKELGYASDLDLVFVFEDDHPDAPTTYARLAQRINTWISSHSAAGLLFETDLRLRPSGNDGLIACSLEAFEKYQREAAWTWEHQALTRARFCAGNGEVGSAFERLRHQILCQRRDLPELRKEVVAMRAKMYDAHANKGEGFELKQDAGGLIDVEFIIQYLVLAHAHLWPALAANTGTIALLRLSGDVGLLPTDLSYYASDAYRELRRAQHAQRLNQQSSPVQDETLKDARDAVQRLWQNVFPNQNTQATQPSFN